MVVGPNRMAFVIFATLTLLFPMAFAAVWEAGSSCAEHLGPGADVVLAQVRADRVLRLRQAPGSPSIPEATAIDSREPMPTERGSALVAPLQDQDVSPIVTDNENEDGTISSNAEGLDGASTSSSQVGLVAWVDLRETGASSLTQIFAHRHVRKGFPTNAYFADGLCRAKEEYLEVDDAGVQCSNLPDSSIISTNFGYCNLLPATRQCRYITLLREPLSRMKAAYNYFCKTCNENSCPAKAERSIDTCPQMSVTTYTRNIGNEYVRHFAGERRPCVRDEICHKTPLHGADQIEDEEDYKRALAALTDPGVLVLFLDSLFKEEQGLVRGTSQLSTLFGDVNVDSLNIQKKKHVHVFWPSKEELSMMTDILQLDIRLYAALKVRAVDMYNSGSANGAADTYVTAASDYMNSWGFLQDLAK